VRWIFFPLNISLAIVLLTVAGYRKSVPRESALSVTSPRDAILAPQSGSNAIDRKIALLQQRIEATAHPASLLDRLGWTFVEKARLTHDAGYYKLAELCAQVMEPADSPTALLLLGHARQSLHDFAGAEAAARLLVEKSPSAPAFGLLGDTLLDRGQLDEAAAAYAEMASRSTGLPAFSRLAQVHWWKGDLSGAIEFMQQAAVNGSSRDPEAIAWVRVKLGFWQMESGEREAALKSAREAKELVGDYSPALLLEGRLLLAAGRAGEAIVPLQIAADATRLPEYQWALVDGLEMSGQPEAAEKLGKLIRTRGAVSDPRTLSLFLATRGEETARAVALAREEMQNRQDIFTHDALAWALLANGQTAEAAREMQKALAAGTRDARLFLHAALIAAATGDGPAASRWQDLAEEFSQSLLPSEKTRLNKLSALRLQAANGPPQLNIK